MIIGLGGCFFSCYPFSPWPPPRITLPLKMTFMGMSMPMAKMGNKSRVENVIFGGLVDHNYMDQKKSVTMNPKNKTYFEQATRERVPFDL